MQPEGPTTHRKSKGAWMQPRRAILALLCLLGLIAVLGGGSREDIASLPVLRTIAAMFCAAAFIWIDQGAIKALRWPLTALALVAALCLVQTLPLPQAMQFALANRDGMAGGEKMLISPRWRPISQSYSATWNSLFSLTVPLAVVLWLGIVGVRRTVLFAIPVIGMISAAIGIMQVFADPQSGLYFYEITNNGSAVGLFANRNHHAVYLACCIIVSVLLRLTSHSARERLAWTGAIGFLGVAIIANSSRAGLIALAVASFSGVILGRFASADHGSRKLILPNWFGPALAGAISLAIVSAFILAERSPAFERLIDTDRASELRDDLLPISIAMAKDYWPLGAGMGSYEHAFRAHEPTSLVGPAYVNEAHNDWLQFIVEGGLPAFLILMGFTSLIAVKAVKLFRRAGSKESDWKRDALQASGLGIVIILSLASLVDYPLRTPLILAIGIIALAMVTAPALKGTGSASAH